MVTDPFDILSDIKMLINGAAAGEFNGTMVSLYLIAMCISAIGILISILTCGLKLTYVKKGDSRDEAKKELFWKILLGVAIFSLTTILGISYEIAKSFIN